MLHSLARNLSDCRGRVAMFRSYPGGLAAINTRGWMVVLASHSAVEGLSFKPNALVEPFEATKA
jgi:hypothetical protein